MSARMRRSRVGGAGVGLAGVVAKAVSEVAPVEVGPGCFRRDLPSTDGVRVWVVDMSPGSEWPHVDVHDASGEEVFVVDGELIEEGRRYGPGTYLFFPPHSRHRPSTVAGVRLFGFNLAARS
jgi:hypothetical protein